MKKKYFCFLLLALFLFVSCSTDHNANNNGDDEEIIDGDDDNDDEEEEGKFIIGKNCVIAGKTYVIDSIYTENIEKGVIYARLQIKNSAFPLVIHALELNTDKSIEIKTWMGKDSIRGRETLSAMVKRKQSKGENIIAAINGDFFDMTGATAGIPLGGEMYNGVLTKSPADNEPLIAFDKDSKPTCGFINFESRLIYGLKAWALSGVNTTRETNYIVLYNSFYGNTTRTNEWGEELLLSPLEGSWETLSSYRNVKCKVEKITHIGTGGAMLIPKGKIVISGHGTAVEYLKNYKPGDEITIDINLNYKDNTTANNVCNMIGSHSVILKNNTYSGLNDEISVYRHPRTAVGYTSDKNKTYFVVIEGRHAASAGVKTSELADILKHIGASDGVNLDGGGSSCMIIGNKIKNVLSDASERAVANGLAVYSVDN